MSKMKRILETYRVSKVGLAIEIEDPEERARFFNAERVDLWEGGYWKNKLDLYPEKDDLYLAPVDTTFCIYDRDRLSWEIEKVHANMSVNTSSIRIAGRFKCRHMGWWFDQPLTEEEYAFYKSTHIWSSTETMKENLKYS